MNDNYIISRADIIRCPEYAGPGGCELNCNTIPEALKTIIENEKDRFCTIVYINLYIRRTLENGKIIEEKCPYSIYRGKRVLVEDAVAEIIDRARKDFSIYPQRTITKMISDNGVVAICRRTYPKGDAVDYETLHNDDMTFEEGLELKNEDVYAKKRTTNK